MTRSIEALLADIRGCRRCQEAGHPVTAPPIASAAADATMMIVGQAPGRVEAGHTGLPFSGTAGKRLFGWLAQCGWDEAEFRRSQAMTAVTKCYPGPSLTGRGDRTPGTAEQALCRPWLEQELAAVQPLLVVPVGGVAIGCFLGNVSLAAVVGRRFARPAQDEALTGWARRHLPAQACLVPLPHPSGASSWLNQTAHRALVAQALSHLHELSAAIAPPGWQAAGQTRAP